MQEQYSELHKVLSSLPVYKPICPSDIALSESYCKKGWLSSLALPIQSRSTAIHMGTNLEQFHSSGKSVSQDETSLARVLSVVTGKLKVYATRAMKQQFMSKYSRVAHPWKAVLCSMFRELVHDSSSACTSEEAVIDERVALAQKFRRCNS